MKKCKVCEAEFKPSRSSSEFCTRKCANIYNGKKRLVSSNKARICDICNKLKPAHKFSLIKKWEYSGPRKTTCKKCSAAIREKQRRENFWGMNIELYLVSQAKQRSKRNETNFCLKQSDIKVPSVCPVLGVDMPVEFRAGKTRNDLRHNYGPSLDRIDNSKGYVPDNVEVMSYRANMLKSDATLEELVLLGEWAKKQLERTK